SRRFDEFGLSRDALRGSVVLDVGSWTGGVSLVLSRLGASVVAIDPKRTCVEALGYLARTFDVAIEARHMDLDDVANLGRTFDGIYCLGVIYHVPNPLLALERLRSVLNPGGYLAIESMVIDA